MNILNKLAFATATFTLSCAVLSSAHQAKAATLGGTFDFTVSGFISGDVDQALTGTFSGEDINGNGILDKQELSAFSVSFPGLGIGGPFSLSLDNLESFSYDGTNLGLLANSLEVFPIGGFLDRGVYVSENSSSVIQEGRNNFGGLTSSNTPPKVTKVSSIPEPEENGAVLGAVGLVGFLLKKRIASTKATQLKTQE